MRPTGFRCKALVVKDKVSCHCLCRPRGRRPARGTVRSGLGSVLPSTAERVCIGPVWSLPPAARAVSERRRSVVRAGFQCCRALRTNEGGVFSVVLSSTHLSQPSPEEFEHAEGGERRAAQVEEVVRRPCRTRQNELSSSQASCGQPTPSVGRPPSLWISPEPTII